MSATVSSKESAKARDNGGRRRPRKKLHTRLHRWLGMGSLVIVLVISITGIALNHTTRLELDQRIVTWSPLLRLYGMEPTGDPSVYLSGERLLASWDGQLILDEVIVDFAPESVPFLGGGEAEAELLVFVFPNTIIVVESTGAVFDRLDSLSLFESPIARAGVADTKLVVETEAGDRFGLVDWLTATPFPEADTEIGWFTPLAPNSLARDQREMLASALRGQGLSLSRILLDLHSGRLFGTVGVVLYDLAAVSLILLGISGVMLWFRRR